MLSRPHGSSCSNQINNGSHISVHRNMLDLDDPSFVFKKRKGTTDEGGQFEDLYLAHLLLTLVNNEKITTFNVWSNHPEFGAMDDTVFDVVSNDTTLTGKYAVQLKYANGGGILTKQALSAKQGDFSILKYFEEYRKKSQTVGTFKFFLVTNRNFDVAEKEIKIDNNITVKFHLSIKNVQKKKNYFKFCIKDTVTSDLRDFEDFFKHFTLVTNHESVDHIKENIRDTFRAKFGCEDELVYKKYIEFVEKWSKNKSSKTTLHSSFVKHVIALLMFSPLTEFLRFDQEPIGKESKLLRKSFSKFDIIFVSKDSCHKVKKLWYHMKKRQSVANEKYLQKARQYQIFRPCVGSLEDLNDEECTKFLWLMGKCPLIVQDNEVTQKAIGLCEQKKFIIFNNKSSSDYSSHRVFRNLLDLKKRKKFLHKRVLTTFTCSIQGKQAIKLDKLIDTKKKILSILNVNKLVEMLDDALLIGKSEDLPPSPIFRFLSKNIVRYQFLDEADLQKTLIVVSCMSPIHKFEKLFPYIQLITVKECLTKLIIEPGGFVVVSDSNISNEIFASLCKKLPAGQTCYNFRYAELMNGFEWVRSSQKIERLNNFVESTTGTFIAESDLLGYEDDNNINLVCADPGMGKTTLVKTLKNISDPSIWSIFVCVRDHSKYFRGGENDVAKFKLYISGTIRAQNRSFDSKVAEILAEEGRIKYFWDGLDELSDASFKTVKNIISNLSIDGSKHWVTSRCHLRQDLQKHFNVLARTIRELDQRDQKKYLADRIECSAQDLEGIFMKIRDNIRLFHQNDILGIPLQLYMLTELIRKDQQKYRLLLNKLFSLADLYQHFVDEKFNVYFREKEGISNMDEMNDIVYGRISEEKCQRVDYYKNSSLRLYFEDDILRNFKTNIKITKKRDPIGFITNVNNEFYPEFFHNSFGEYFAALYLAEHPEEASQIPNFIFDDKYNNIRFFLDLILSDNSPVHIAVLYKNLQMLEDCQDEQYLSKDKNGRSALEVACSWSEKYQLLNVKTGNKYRVSGPPFCKKEPSVNRSMLEFLLTKCSNEEVSKVLKDASSFYGNKCLKLLPTVILTKATKIKTKNFQENVFTILRYCIRFDYDDLIDVCEELDQLESENGVPFTHLLILNRSMKIIRKLRRSEKFKGRLTSYDHDFVRTACLKGDDGIMLRFLVDEGVNLNTPDQTGRTPIHYLRQHSNFFGIRLLIENGIKMCSEDYSCKTVLHGYVIGGGSGSLEWLIRGGALMNFRDKRGRTPLHYACDSGNSTMAKILIERGAKSDVIDNNGRTPTFLAYSKKRIETLEVLLELVGQIALSSASGDSLIHDASEQGYHDLVKMLVDKNMNLDVVNKYGEMPIHIACRRGHAAIVKLLLDNGQSVNVVDKYGQLPMHLACEAGHREVVELLMKNSSQINVKNKYGQTPLQLAYQAKHAAIVNFLTDKSSIVSCFTSCPMIPSSKKKRQCDLE